MKLFKKQLLPLLFLVSIFMINGCALFTSHYNETRHENYTKLKAHHVKFIEDYTDGSEKKWGLEAIKKVCDDGDLKFREALSYATSKDGKHKTGERATAILQEQFKSDCKLILKDRKKLFGKKWVELNLPQIKQMYGYAIDGELGREKGKDK